MKLAIAFLALVLLALTACGLLDSDSTKAKDLVSKTLTEAKCQFKIGETTKLPLSAADTATGIASRIGVKYAYLIGPSRPGDSPHYVDLDTQVFIKSGTAEFATNYYLPTILCYR
jgi:hypothetical protein